MSASVFQDLQVLESQQRGDPLPENPLVPFNVLDVGRNGNIELVPTTKNNLYPQLSTLPLGLGPFESEDVKSELTEWYLKPKKVFPREILDECQRYWDREPDVRSFLHTSVSKSRTMMEMDRSLVTGEVDFFSYREVVQSDSSRTAQNSTSLQREPASYTDFVRGHVSNFPFAPGGLDDVAVSEKTHIEAGIEQDIEAFLKEIEEGELLSVPPGFDRGLMLKEHPKSAESQQTTPSTATTAGAAASTTLNLMDILTADDFVSELLKEEEDEEKQAQQREEEALRVQAEQEQATKEGGGEGGGGSKKQGYAALVQAKKSLASKTTDVTAAHALLDGNRDVFAQYLDEKDKKEGSKVTDPKLFREFAAYWEDEYFKDMDALNIRRPDILTRVSEYVPEIIAYVQKIIDNGFA
ncbi:hypothetical protein HK102_004106, partial [Quaeritorhiza haematococci]